jgi:Family of unknown function (DUF6065)
MDKRVEDAGVDPWVRLYVERGAPLPRVVPAPVARKWFGPEMYRCLPLTIANQMGWTVLNPAAFSATWDGGDSADAVTGTTDGSHVLSRFGHGLVSIHPGFYVRTSPDVDLFVKGVPNRPKDGVACLEALIETDWFDGRSSSSFLTLVAGCGDSVPRPSPTDLSTPNSSRPSSDGAAIAKRGWNRCSGASTLPTHSMAAIAGVCVETTLRARKATRPA